MTATIEVKGLTKRYGPVEAVRDLSFALEPGEIIALVGHNGAGKTTLLKLLLGLVRPSEGSIRVLGENPAAGEFDARRRLGYLPENVSFNPALTARELHSFYAKLKGQPVAVALELLDRVGLGSASSRRLGTYSKGMRQRLGLFARACRAWRQGRAYHHHEPGQDSRQRLDRLPARSCTPPQQDPLQGRRCQRRNPFQ